MLAGVWKKMRLGGMTVWRLIPAPKLTSLMLVERVRYASYVPFYYNS